MQFLGDRFTKYNNFQIFSDELRFQQVVLNLLSNAIKFTFQGQILIKLEYVDQQQDNSFYMPNHHSHEIEPPSRQARNDRIKVTVEDTGIGITDNDQKRLFQMFRIVKSTK